nr:alpha/beta hydrolase-fold protein [Fredinandcohnia onubensis]
MALLNVKYHSEILGMPVEMAVLMPQSFTENRKTFPTLYLLHEMGDGHTSWLRKTSLERYIDDLSLAIVMPAGHTSYYTDTYHGKPYFTFITEELPAICENMFPLSQSKNERFIAGNGIGGYGALKAGLSAPDTFILAAAFSSPIDIMRIVNRIDKQKAVDIFGRVDEIINSSENLYVAAENLQNANNPLPEIYLSCNAENGLFEENESYNTYLSNLGVKTTFKKTMDEQTDWKHWDHSLEKFISWLTIAKPGLMKRGNVHGAN